MHRTAPRKTAFASAMLTRRTSSALPHSRAARSNRRVRTVVGRQRSGPVWLFDLDNTLHHASHAIFPFINREMTAFIERTLQVDRDTANRLRTVYTRRYGAALLGLIRRHGIDAHAFLREVHPASIDLPAMVRAERGLAQTLKALPGRRIVLTNGPAEYARTVLAILGIERLFERVLAIEDMRRGAHWHAKPDAAVIRGILRQAKTSPSNTILVEDTHTHLKRYRRMGIRTVWITGHLPEHFRWPDGRPHYVDRRVRTLQALRRLKRIR